MVRACYNMRHVQTTSDILLAGGGSKVNDYLLDGKQKKPKVNVPLMIDANKNKNVGRQEVN